MKLILQEREAQSCDTRCICHPQDIAIFLSFGQSLAFCYRPWARDRRRVAKGIWKPFVKVLPGWKSVVLVLNHKIEGVPGHILLYS